MHANDFGTLTVETRARKMREAFGKLAGQFIAEGQVKKSAAVQKAIESLDPYNESLALLYDLINAP